MRFKNELVRNITIKLGYANAKVGPLFLHCVLVLLACGWWNVWGTIIVDFALYGV